MFTRPILAVVAVALLAGCHTPARMTFSPDGSRALWASNVDGLMRLIDADGTVLETLGPGVGAGAWTSDGRTLYFAARSDTPPPLADRDESLWISRLRGIDPFPLPEPGSLDDPISPGDTLYRWRDGKAEPLAALGGGVWNLLLSPDEQSLLISMSTDLPTTAGGTEQAGLLALYTPADETLRPISAMAGLNLVAAFTPDGEIVCVRVSSLDSPVGELVRLSPKRSGEEPTLLAMIALPGNGYLARHGQTLLLSSVPLTLPMNGASLDGDFRLQNRLYRVNLAARSLEPIAEHVGQFFALSPDGSRVLIEHVVPREGEPPTRSLAVMSVDGGSVRDLRPLDGYDEKLPMFPAWRTNDELAFVPPPDRAVLQRFEEKTIQSHEVVLYRLGAEGLGDLRPLSPTWPIEARPGVEQR
jgi:hypothetical protein